MAYIRDEEIKRLVNYAKGLNCPINFYDETNEHGHGLFYIDGSHIDIYTKGLSKVYIVLVLIHEIAHLTAFIKDFNRKVDEKYHEASKRMDLALLLGKNTTKKDRKILLDAEMDDTKYWDEIIMNCNIRIPPKRVEAERRYNEWCYTYFYENGELPSPKQEKAARKRIRKDLNKVYK